MVWILLKLYQALEFQQMKTKRMYGKKEDILLNILAKKISIFPKSNGNVSSSTMYEQITKTQLRYSMLADFQYLKKFDWHLII